MKNFARALGMLMLLGVVGCGTPSFLITPVSNTNTLEESLAEPGSGFSPDKIVIIDIEGMIANAQSGGFLQPTENKVSLFVQQLRRAEQDPRVKAVVLRINSPGGTVTASDTMYQELLRFKAKTHKPVIASTQEIAASGAYYIACASDKIIAHPTSLVGSIGVIFETFDASGTMEKIGVRSDAIKSGPNKDIGSPFRPMKPEERALMQGLIDEYYARFKGVVTANRHIDPANLAMATDGRVFSGAQAVKIGLADETGLLEDAITAAKTAANAPKAQVLLYRRPYGYGGSIYASSHVNPATAGAQNNPAVLQLQLPGSDLLAPTGFCFLWQP